MSPSLSGLEAPQERRKGVPGRRPYPGISPRRRAVLLGVANGRSNKEIARDLFVSVETVKTNLSFLTKKFGAGDRAHIVALALRSGLIHPTEIVVPGECPGTVSKPNYCRCSCPGCQDNCTYHFGESGPALAD
jgi:DNA-binding CsgD family transcriptional regulator